MSDALERFLNDLLKFHDESKHLRILPDNAKVDPERRCYRSTSRSSCPELGSRSLLATSAMTPHSLSQTSLLLSPDHQKSRWTPSSVSGNIPPAPGSSRKGTRREDEKLKRDTALMMVQRKKSPNVSNRKSLSCALSTSSTENFTNIRSTQNDLSTSSPRSGVHPVGVDEDPVTPPTVGEAPTKCTKGIEDSWRPRRSSLSLACLIQSKDDYFVSPQPCCSSPKDPVRDTLETVEQAINACREVTILASSY